MKTMSKALAAVGLIFLSALPMYAQSKENERLTNSATVLEQIVSDTQLPASILSQSDCVLVFPSVKKVAIGIGGSYGRGVLVCRTGADMHGQWGAPVMYKLDQGSIGVQLGGTATDFVLVIMNQKGAEQILNNKTKLGADAKAQAGPTGAQASGYNADSMNVDVLTYSRSKGLFAGVSLEGASMESDEDANKSLYGKDVTTHSIISGGQKTPASADALLAFLNKTSPTHK
jgi:SH3 domain-containing YSC84-like protein 1